MDKVKVKAKGKVEDPLKCPQCGKVAHRRWTSANGESFLWDHRVDEGGSIAQTTSCMMKKEEYYAKND